MPVNDAQSTPGDSAPPCNTGSATAWLLGCAAALFAGAMCLNPATANDLFWQLRTGHEIVATHTIPHADHFSWTRYGHPWVVHEWGAFVLLWLAYAATGGYAGVWLLQTALVVLTFALLFVALKRETHAPVTALVLGAWATIVAAAYFQPRPQLFTYLFLTVELLVLQTARRNPARNGTLWLLVPMCALWANLHAGVIVGVGILALIAFGEAVDLALARHPERGSEHAVDNQGLSSNTGNGYVDTNSDNVGPADASDIEPPSPDLRLALRLAVVAAACGAATLLNPYGRHVYNDFFATVSDATAMSRVNEWASPNFHQPFGRLIEGLALILFLGATASRRRRRAGDFFVVLLLLSQTLYAGRNAPLFAIAASVLWAGHFQSALEAFLARLRREGEPGESIFGSAPPLIAAAALAAVLIAASMVRVVQMTHHQVLGHGLESIARKSFELSTCPERACRFLDAEGFPATMQLYNAYGDGGYLIWRAPRYPVFIDGRADVYFGGVLDDYARLNKLPFDWRETIDLYKIDVALLTTREPQARLFLAAPGWALVYADRPQLDDGPNDDKPVNALIFVRRTPVTASLIARSRRDCAAFHTAPAIWARYNDYAAIK